MKKYVFGPSLGAQRLSLRAQRSNLRTVVLMLGCILGMQRPAFAEITFGPNVRVDDSGDSPTHQSGPAMAADTDGNAHIVLTDKRNDEENNWNSDIYFARSLQPGDINIDYRVDLIDFTILGNQWLGTPGSPSADIAPDGGDGVVDSLDLGKIADYWLEGTSF